MPKNLEELSSREISVDAFKRLRLRGKLKCCAYDIACNMAWWPGYAGAFVGAAAKYSLQSSGNHNATNPLDFFTPVLIGAAAFSALKTSCYISKEYRKAKNEKQNKKS